MPPLSGEFKEVPKFLHGVFKERREILEIVEYLKQAMMTAGAWQYEGKSFDIDFEKFSQHVVDAVREIYLGIPHKPCDCEAFSKCEHCKGKRWMTLREANLRERKSPEDWNSNAFRLIRKLREEGSPVERSS
jgi:hypothetical protein